MTQKQIADYECITIDNEIVTINNFKENDAAVVGLIKQAPEPGAMTHEIMRVGAAVLSLSTDRVNTELIDSKFRNMATAMETNLKQTTDEIRGAFNSIVSGEEALFPSLLQSAEDRIMARLQDTFDPESTKSAIAIMRQVLADARRQQVAVIDELLSDAESGALGKLNHSLTNEFRRIEDALSNDIAKITQQIAVDEAVASERASSAKKGLIYEEQVSLAVAALSPSLGGIAEAVGTHQGTAGNRKGDIVLSLADTRGLKSDARVVIEAKAKRMRFREMTEELDACMENREAQAAIAVFQSQDTAPTEVPFQQYGDKAIVVYDGEDDAALRVGLLWGQMKAVASNDSIPGDGLDLERIEGLFATARSQLNRFSALRGHHTASKNALDKASDVVGQMQDELGSIIDELFEELCGDRTCA